MKRQILCLYQATTSLQSMKRKDRKYEKSTSFPTLPHYGLLLAYLLSYKSGMIPRDFKWCNLSGTERVHWVVTEIMILNVQCIVRKYALLSWNLKLSTVYKSLLNQKPTYYITWLSQCSTRTTELALRISNCQLL